MQYKVENIKIIPISYNTHDTDIYIYIYIYICVCVCVCVYIYIYIYIYKRCNAISVRIHTGAHTCTDIYKHFVQMIAQNG